MEASITRALANQALAVSYSTLPAHVAAIARQCVLDWVGVTLAGSREPLSASLASVLTAQSGCASGVTIPGMRLRLASVNAALLNGTASHALDYDDVSFSVPGHASAAVLAAAFALAEEIGASGVQLLEAFVAGYEVSCRVGTLIAPSHYARGFHATATAGSFGAAAACARLLNLRPEQLAIAFGIAATRFAGLKASFGTSCKPLQCGNAASNGLFAALLAQAGFDGPSDILEHRIGIAALFSSDFHSEAALGTPTIVRDFSDPPRVAHGNDRYHLAFNLFKYHASCYETHSAIECGLQIAERIGHRIDRIKSVRLRVNRHCNDICNIQSPISGLEAKFSLRLTAAFALSNAPTADPDLYCTENATAPEYVALRDKITIELSDDIGVPVANMTVTMDDDRILEASHNSSEPASDLEAQRERLTQKFIALATVALGAERAQQVPLAIERLHEPNSLNSLLALMRG